MDSTNTIDYRRIVYFVRGANLIKIGRTESIEARLLALRGSSPVPLSLVAAVYETALGLTEIDLHKRFRHLRDHGEWYHIQPELIEFIDNDPIMLRARKHYRYALHAHKSLAKKRKKRLQHDTEVIMGRVFA
jgi:hypothetical protein